MGAKDKGKRFRRWHQEFGVQLPQVFDVLLILAADGFQLVHFLVSKVKNCFVFLLFYNNRRVDTTRSGF